MITLAYTPFIDPLPIQSVWYLTLPLLALGVAMAYKAVRVRELSRYPAQVVMFTFQILGGVIALGLLAILVIDILLPLISPMPGA
ncbi:MAG: hypothetical protein AAFP26_04375 [Planctomycetota bacterium]